MRSEEKVVLTDKMREDIIKLWREGYSTRSICKRTWNRVEKRYLYAIEEAILEWNKMVWAKDD